MVKPLKEKDMRRALNGPVESPLRRQVEAEYEKLQVAMDEEAWSKQLKRISDAAEKRERDHAADMRLRQERAAQEARKDAAAQHARERRLVMWMCVVAAAAVFAVALMNSLMKY